MNHYITRLRNPYLLWPFAMWFCIWTYSTGHAQQPGLRHALGKAATIIDAASKVETVRLQIVSYTESRQHPLVFNRIAGYPLIDKPVVLGLKQSQQLASLLLDEQNYSYNLRRRCEDSEMVGVRFIKGSQRVDVSIGLQCRFISVNFRDGIEVRWWEEIMRQEAAEQLLDLLAQP